MLGFFKEFHDRSRFVKILNATFLVLIPKKQNVKDLRDLRPISLVDRLSKILTKVLANRIKRVMGKIISQSQSAFVEGRQILDAILIANEVVDSTSKEKRLVWFANWTLKKPMIASIRSLFSRLSIVWALEIGG